MAPRLRPRDAEQDRQAKDKAAKALKNRLSALERRIAEKEQALRDLEHVMASPGFYEDRQQADAAAANHRSLNAEVQVLMGEWEALQTEAEVEG